MTPDLATSDARLRRVETRDDASADAVERRERARSHRYGMTHDVDTTAPSAGTSLGDDSHETLLLKLDEVARELRCTRRSLERQIAARRLRVIHIGRSVRVERSALENYLAGLRAEEPVPQAERRG